MKYTVKKNKQKLGAHSKSNWFNSKWTKKINKHVKGPDQIITPLIATILRKHVQHIDADTFQYNIF